MKNTYIVLIFLILLSCNNDSVNKPEMHTDSLKYNETVTPAIYKYEIKNIKTGKTILITEDEYIQSDYINNNNYSIKEIPLVDKKQ